MKKIISILICITIILSLCSCSTGNDTSFVMGVTDEINSFNPLQAQTQTEKILSSNCFEGLLRFNEDGKIALAGATSYTVTNNGLTYTFTLNPDACFYLTETVKATIEALGLDDFKSKITAHDYVYGIDFFNKSYADIFVDVKKVYASDEHTLEITLKKSDPDFLYKLASYPVYPLKESFVKQLGDLYGSTVSTILTNGPYYVESSEDSETVIRKNPKYNGNIQIKNKQITLYTTGKYESLEERFENSEYDFFTTSSISNPPYSDSAIAYENTVWGIAFNCRSQTSSNAKLRKALLGSLNPTTLSLPDYALNSATGIIPSSYIVSDTPYSSFAAEPFEYTADIQKSKKNLNAYFKETGTTEIRLNFLVPEGFKADAEKITDNWIDIFGECIFTQIKTYSPENAEFISENESYDIAVLPLYTDNKTAKGILESVTGSTCNYTNKKYIKLLNNISPVVSESIEDYHKAEMHLIDNGIFVPLFTTGTLLFLNKSVSGIYIADGGNHLYLYGGTNEKSET